MSDILRHKAWTSGNKASKAGKKVTSCRYKQGTIYYDDWCDGFNDHQNTLPHSD